MTRRSRHASLAPALAAAFLDGAWTERAMADRAARNLEFRPRWLRRVAREVLVLYPRAPVDRILELSRAVAIVLERLDLAAASGAPRVVRRRLLHARIERRRWNVPEIATQAELASFLDLDVPTFEWLADVRGLERSVADDRLRNYHYAWLARRDGPARVIEAPKSRLKQAQRLVLHEVLDRIAPHDAAHGFRRGYSARTHATVHVGRRVVLRFDLEDFFASVRAGRVFGIFRVAGYPEGVAHALTALATNAVPVAEWAAVPRPREPWLIDAHHRLGRRLATPHLPQGAPTSPALASLCAFGLDRRLTGLAASFGARYSRYADDLAISGDGSLVRRAETVRRAVSGIAREEGFAVNERKSQLMSRAGRQRLCGIVINDRPNIPRPEYDRLKAVLHDAARNGPQAANRTAIPDFRAHLQGRIAWVESLNPQRGRRLRDRFARITW